MSQALSDLLARHDQLSETATPGETMTLKGKDLPYIDNDIEKYSKRQGKSTTEIDHMADQLVELFNNPGYRSYYCKVAAALSTGTIQNNIELAMRGREPARYFSWLCTKAMK